MFLWLRTGQGTGEVEVDYLQLRVCHLEAPMTVVRREYSSSRASVTLGGRSLPHLSDEGEPLFSHVCPALSRTIRNAVLRL